MTFEAATTVTAGRVTQWMIVLGASLILAGIVVGAGRRLLHQQDGGSSIVRSWIAISLVIGLLFFCAATFAIDDTTIRSVLIGALAANAGTAIAFYFSSKASEQARKDVLDATFGTETVPDLTGKTLDEARRLVSESSLSLTTTDGTSGATVATQSPAAGSVVRKGTSIVVTLG